MTNNTPLLNEIKLNIIEYYNTNGEYPSLLKINSSLIDQLTKEVDYILTTFITTSDEYENKIKLVLKVITGCDLKIEII